MISIAGFYFFIFFGDTGDSGCFFINLIVGPLATIGHHVSGPASSIFSLSAIVSIFPATAAATEAIFFTIFFCVWSEKSCFSFFFILFSFLAS